MAERVAALYGIAAMLPLLAVVNMVCAWQVRQLAMSGHRLPHARRTDGALSSPPSRRRRDFACWHTRRISRNLAAIVMLAMAAATLADYVFKVQAVGILGRGDELLRFFAIYYAATSLLSFVVQSVIGATALQRLGLALTTSTPSLALLFGGIGAMFAPGLQGSARCAWRRISFPWVAVPHGL